MCAKGKVKKPVSVPQPEVVDPVGAPDVPMSPKQPCGVFVFSNVPEGCVQKVVTKEELIALEKSCRIVGYHNPSKTALFKKES